MNIASPKAPQKPKKLIKHKDIRIDPYYWMNQRGHKDVLKYLEAENSYLKKICKPIEGIKEKLFKEMKNRMVKDESTVPVQRGLYEYYVRYEKDKEYPLYCRKKKGQKKEDIFLDVNKLAKGHKFFDLGNISLSPDQNIVCFSVDKVGRRFFDLHFKNLKTGALLKQSIKKTSGISVWASDNETLFYIDQDPKTLRWDKVHRYNLKSRKTQLAYHEKDKGFSVIVRKSKSQKYIFILSGSKETTEYLFLPADKPTQKPKLFQKRKKGFEYYVSHGGDRFFITHNGPKEENFKISWTPEAKTQKSSWKTWLKHNPKRFIEDCDVYKDFVALQIREKGLTQIQITSRKTKGFRKKTISFKDPAYTVSLQGNPEYDAKTIRYVYESMKQPHSVYDYKISSGRSILKKQKKVLGGFKSSNYITERVWVKVKGKTQVPMSLVYKKGFKKTGRNPFLIYGYGSYGLSIDPFFSLSYLSLLDRGFGIAIAHIRGGSEMGRSWYDKGKKLFKKNTFTDFIECAEFLIKKKYTSSAHLHAMGGSAGGLLMGAVMNMKSSLFKSIVAAVPFVDVLTTMLDESIPLTTAEYEEWGNPNKKNFYKYMKSYSPYDNLKAKDYPHLLVLSGYHDSQVQYWEPTKWVARLRDLKTDNNLTLLQTNMEAGHGGDTGRFQALKERALTWAFLIGLEEKKI